MRLVDRVCEQRKQQRVTVRGRLRDDFGTDIAARARPVIDDDGLAEPIGEPSRHDAGENIGITAPPPSGLHFELAIDFNRGTVRQVHLSDGRPGVAAVFRPEQFEEQV